MLHTRLRFQLLVASLLYRLGHCWVAAVWTQRPFLGGQLALFRFRSGLVLPARTDILAILLHPPKHSISSPRLQLRSKRCGNGGLHGLLLMRTTRTYKPGVLNLWCINRPGPGEPIPRCAAEPTTVLPQVHASAWRSNSGAGARTAGLARGHTRSYEAEEHVTRPLSDETKLVTLYDGPDDSKDRTKLARKQKAQCHPVQIS